MHGFCFYMLLNTGFCITEASKRGGSGRGSAQHTYAALKGGRHGKCCSWPSQEQQGTGRQQGPCHDKEGKPLTNAAQSSLPSTAKIAGERGSHASSAPGGTAAAAAAAAAGTSAADERPLEGGRKEKHSKLQFMLPTLSNSGPTVLKALHRPAHLAQHGCVSNSKIAGGEYSFEMPVPNVDICKLAIRHFVDQSAEHAQPV
eukprot:1140541-Pelagomonas_calceolata.AAC.2